MRRYLFTLVAMLCACCCAAAELENESIKVTFDEANAAFDILDKRSGKTWRQLRNELPVVKVLNVKADQSRIEFDFNYPKLTAVYRGVLVLENGAELSVQVVGPEDAAQIGTYIEYPYPFESAVGERILLPHGGGFAFPVEMTDVGTKLTDYMLLYNRNMNMGVWGQYAETYADDGEILPGHGYMAMIETPENAAVNFCVRSNSLRQINIRWSPDKAKFGYARRLRYAFFERCNVVTVAKRYLTCMKQKGYYVPFTEKLKKDPVFAERLNILFGAPNIWYWGPNKVPVAKRLKELGFDNFIMNCAGGAEAFQNYQSSDEEVRELAKIPNILVGCYDIYNDLIEPTRLPEVRYISKDWPIEAWEKGDVRYDADGKPARGWRVYPKDPVKPMVGCSLLCEARAPEYARERIGRILKTAPFTARFLDVTGTSVSDCYHPKHPLNRRTSVLARQKLLNVPHEFNLVTGTEDGVECYVPVCDYFEGMFSAPNHYRVDGGRFMWKIYDNVPDNIGRFGVNVALRVPFWELVFHDCVVSYWYWCDYNNKFTQLWWKRDLLNAVCGTPPMYLFDAETFSGIGPKLTASVRIAQPVSRMTSFRPSS